MKWSRFEWAKRTTENAILKMFTQMTLLTTIFLGRHSVNYFEHFAFLPNRCGASRAPAPMLHRNDQMAVDCVRRNELNSCNNNHLFRVQMSESPPFVLCGEQNLLKLQQNCGSLGWKTRTIYLKFCVSQWNWKVNCWHNHLHSRVWWCSRSGIECSIINYVSVVCVCGCRSRRALHIFRGVLLALLKAFIFEREYLFQPQISRLHARISNAHSIPTYEACNRRRARAQLCVQFGLAVCVGCCCAFDSAATPCPPMKSSSVDMLICCGCDWSWRSDTASGCTGAHSRHLSFPCVSSRNVWVDFRFTVFFSLCFIVSTRDSAMRKTHGMPFGFPLGFINWMEMTGARAHRTARTVTTIEWQTTFQHRPINLMPRQLCAYALH